MIRLQHEMIYTLEVEGPLAPRDGSPSEGAHQWWQMSKASLAGPRIAASSPMPGMDWFSPGGAGYGRPHVKLPLMTDDGALILLEYRGVVEASREFAAAFEQDWSTGWDDQYMRMAMFFETTSERYQWLVRHLFLARGRLKSAREIEYDIYRVD